MSFMDNVGIYKKIITQDIMQKPYIDESSTEFVILPKHEYIEETLVVGEEIIVHENMDIDQQISEESTCETKETSGLFEGNIGATMSVEYADDSITLSTNNISKKKWFPNDPNKHNLLLSEPEETESEIQGNKTRNNDQDGDEETIATFVTAAGQQLALYAVEDSEEIFAVAVYDESGEPPTNFQFLMKADVERLIGEGAVRTVKKPTQIKKQLLTTQPPIFLPKDETMHTSARNEIKTESSGDQRIRKKGNIWNEGSSLSDDTDLNLNMKQVPNIMYTSDDKQSDVTYLMMDDDSVNTDNSEDCQEDGESDDEIIEQSTVQYILFDGDQSDSELTYDEIQATLQNLKAAELKSSKKQPSRTSTRDRNDLDNAKEIKYQHSTREGSNKNLSNNFCNTLTERKLNLIDSETEYLETSIDSPTDMRSNNTNLDLSNGSIECTSPESARVQCKTKRSRKQQLVSVNREDSEIIIQPASLLNEEDSNVRKKGKRKKKRVIDHTGYRQKNNEPKKMKKAKRKEVEIIEIDVDEGESMLQSKRDVVEITIDDSKDKYSSDKENEIIMVGDSDDESQEANSKTVLLQCQHCSRNFRQPRALETHLRVCSKSPLNVVRFNDKLKRTEQINKDTVKKQYACKICQKKFDVVVALARHVRSEHSQKKKRRYSKSSMDHSPIQAEELKEPVETKKQLTMIRKMKRKRNQRAKCTWEVKKLSCSDCGRWFPSAALLRAHCLQHGTKKSEQQIRRCHICKKLIRSRLLFVQHLKKHGSMQKNTKSRAHIQKKLHTTRSVTSKITTLRKRGRPRKL